jgi:hypothetical protein
MTAIELPSRRGRPQKFGRPARPITLTLPEDVIAALARIDDDVSRAVVRVVQPTLSTRHSMPPVELSKFGKGAVIVIRPVPAMSRIPGVKLAPLPDGRTLITLKDSMTVYEFELRLRDALESDRNMKPWERSIMSSVGDLLKSARKTNKLSLHRRGIIVLQAYRQKPIASKAAAGPRRRSAS